VRNEALNTFGRHLLVEYRGCNQALLDDQEALERLMIRAALSAGATIVTSSFHTFAPQGVSGVVVIQESHLSIHTWPEVGYASADFYTCGDCRPELAHEALAQGLGSTDYEVIRVNRGLEAERSMNVVRHTQHSVGSDIAVTAATGGAQ
jgi:S-adenosylmethionine decarboxylase